MASVGEIRARITLDSSEFRRGADEARNSMGGMKKDFSAIQKASTVVSGAVAAVIGASIKTAANFEQAMARVKAISGATDDEFKALEQTARDLGASTQFSASEAAEAMSFLAMAGFKVNETISAMPGVLNLAAASQESLGTSADIVSNIMSGFGLNATEADTAVDVLVKTMTTANTNLPQLGNAMKYVAPIAASLGIPIEQAAAAVGKMSDAGIQGSQAGTSLRAMLLSLTNPVGQTEKAMERLGVNVNDAAGEMMPLPELIGHVSERLDGLTDAQKTAEAAQLVGTEAASGFLALMAIGEEDLAAYTAELKDSAGAAQDMATIQQDTVNGAFKEFQSALEEVGIVIGNEFLPVFRDVIEAGADLVRFIGAFDGDSIKLALSFAGITAAVAGTLATVGKLSIALSAFAMTPVGAAIVGISLLAGIVGTAVIASNDLKEVTFETADALIAEQDALNTSVARYDELKSSMSLTSDELQRFVDINSLMKQTTDPAVLAALKDEQGALLEKSTLTNDEFAEFLGLNSDLIALLPDATVTISDQGNALLDSTSAAKGLNDEIARKIELELEAQLAKAESNEAENLRTQKSLQKEINDLGENKATLDGKIRDAQIALNGFQKDYNEAKASGDDREAMMLEGKISQQELIIEGAQRTKAEEAELIIKKMEELDLTNEQIGKLQEAKDKLAELTLAQVGLNSKKGEELDAIDDAKLKLIQERRELEKNTPVSARNTGEYQNAVAAIDRQIDALEVARNKVFDITGAASAMNEVLGRSINKSVVIRTIGGTIAGGGRSLKDLEYHTGGLVGRPALNAMPKLHAGGSVAALANRLNAPMQHEMDVRLLKNEMVLTESHQANLMRMIDAGHAGSGTNMSETNALLRDIKSGLADGNDIQIVMNERQVGRAVSKYVSEEQEVDNRIRKRFKN